MGPKEQQGRHSTASGEDMKKTANIIHELDTLKQSLLLAAYLELESIRTLFLVY